MSYADDHMTEAQLQRRILGLCAVLGLRAFHSGDSRRDSCKGYPDLTIVGIGGIIWIELKSNTGRTTDAQFDWLTMLNMNGQTAIIARPVDWPVVEHHLRRLSRHRDEVV